VGLDSTVDDKGLTASSSGTSLLVWFFIGEIEIASLEFLQLIPHAPDDAVASLGTLRAQKLWVVVSLNNQVGATVCGDFVGRAYGKFFATSSGTGGLNS